jgi:hypothetical protein
MKIQSSSVDLKSGSISQSILAGAIAIRLMFVKSFLYRHCIQTNLFDLLAFQLAHSFQSWSKTDASTDYSPSFTFLTQF